MEFFVINAAEGREIREASGLAQAEAAKIFAVHEKIGHARGGASFEVGEAAGAGRVVLRVPVHGGGGVWLFVEMQDGHVGDVEEVPALGPGANGEVLLFAVEIQALVIGHGVDEAALGEEAAGGDVKAAQSRLGDDAYAEASVIAIDSHSAHARKPGSGRRGWDGGCTRLLNDSWGLRLTLFALHSHAHASLLLLLRALWAGWDGLDIGAARFYQWTFNSFSLGLVTAVLAVAMAWMVTAQARLHPGLATRWAERTLGLGYAVPGVVIVVGLLLPVGWLQTHWPSAGVGGWLTASVLGLIWAYLVRFVAVALQSLNSGYARIPPNLDDSSRILGVYGWHLMWRVHAPLLAKPALAATLLVMVDVMKELPATLVLRPFNTDTLAVMTYQLARDERLAEASLPALMLVLVGLLPVILLSKALKADRDE